MSVIIYVPAKKAREMLKSGDYTVLRHGGFYPAYYGAQTYRTRICDNGKVRDVIFWRVDEYESAMEKHLIKLKNKKKKGN